MYAVHVARQIFSVEHAASHVDEFEDAFAVDDPTIAVEVGDFAVAIAVAIASRLHVRVVEEDVEARGIVGGKSFEGVVVVVEHVDFDACDVVDEVKRIKNNNYGVEYDFVGDGKLDSKDADAVVKYILKKK